MAWEDEERPHPPAGEPSVLVAVVAAPAPATVTDELWVKVPGFDGGWSKTGPCQWQGIPGSLPAVGARCVLVEASDDDTTAPWVVVFDGGDVPVPASAAPSGPAGGDLAGTYPNPTLGGTYKAAFPYAAAWGDYAGGNEAATYSRIGRLVLLQGLATRVTAGAPTAFETIGTLPVGFRPASQLFFAVPTGATPSFGSVIVTSAGLVQWWTGNTVEQDFTSLSGISFIV